MQLKVYSDYVKLSRLLLIIILSTFWVSGFAQDVTYSESFANGASYCPGQSQYDNWGNFRNQLDTTTKKFRRVTVKGSQDPTGITCNDPDITRRIADALRNKTFLSVTCNGVAWVVSPGCYGGCASINDAVELIVNYTGTCLCGNPAYIFRPCIGNLNWGGLNGATCSAPTQTMEVIFSNPVGNNASIGGLSAPVTSCGSATDSISAVITNGGMNKIGNIPVVCKVTGTLNGSPYSNTFNGTVTDSLVPAQSKNIKFANLNTSNGADLNIEVYTVYPTDTFHTDDTLRLKYKNVGTPTGNASASNMTRCGSGSVDLTASVPGGHTAYWYNRLNQLIGVGTSIKSTAVPGGTTDSFYVASAKSSAATALSSGFTGGTVAGTGYVAGNMFDLTVTKTITVDSLDIHLNALGKRKVVIYMKNGTYLGSQNNAAAWTRIAEYEVESKGAGTPTRLNFKPMEVAPGTYGVYIYASENMIWNANTSLAINDNDLVINGGIAMRDTFANQIPGPVRWNGTIHYRQVCVSGNKVKVKVTANPLAVGGDMAKGAPFKGVYDAGLINQPDVVASPDSITYSIVAPTGYNNTNHGTMWNIVSTSVKTINGATLPSTMYKYTAPSGSTNGSIQFFPGSAYTDSTIEVSVIIRRTDNNCDTVLKRIVFIAPRPAVNFTNTTVCDGDITEFTNTTTISTGTLSYEWKFGDGTGDIVTDPIKQYPGHATYRVVLIATSNWGIIDSSVQNITVKQIPVADFDFTNACEGGSVTFTDRSALPSGTPIYIWNFGDGSPNGTGSTTSRPYAVPNIYNATLTVDVNGCQNSVSKYVTMAPRSKPDFTFTATQCDNLDVTFTNQTVPPAFGSVGYEWDFDDLSASSQISPKHTYNVFNTYNVKLYGKTDLGCIDVATKAITLRESPKPAFTVTGALCSDQAVSFTNNTNVPTGQTNTYDWDFGNGNNSAATSPDYVYDAPGTYKVVLKAFNTNGCQGEGDMMVTINEKPSADYIVNKVCQGAETQFTNNSYISAGVLQYNWDFDNTSTSTAINPAITYAIAKTYNVRMIASTTSGCADTITKPVIVAPIPSVDILPASANTGDGSIKFATTATGVTYQWYFGDGGTSNVQNPTYQYSFSGVWTVKLVVTNPDGCSNSTTTSVFSNPSSINGLQASGAAVYPNPSTGFVYADFSQYTGKSVTNISVTDLLGRTLINQAPVNNNIAELNLAQYPAGVYNLNIETAEGILSVKVLLTR